MRKTVVFMYAGQGSQYFQMARELFEHERVFRAAMDRCERAFSAVTGRSLHAVLYGRAKHEPFESLTESSPAILAVEYGLTQVLTGWGWKPNVLLGYSLGEFVAGVVSGQLSLEDALFAVVRMGDLFEELCPPAFMMAVLARPSLFHTFPTFFSECAMAGVNSSNHFVIAGPSQRYSAVAAALQKQGISFQRLPVTRGFHTHLIDPGKNAFLKMLEQAKFSSPSIPLHSSARGAGRTLAGLEHFWNVVRFPVEFAAAVQELEKRGPCVYVDVGPSGTLASFVKQNVAAESASVSVQSLNAFGQDLKSLAALRQTLERAEM